MIKQFLVVSVMLLFQISAFPSGVKAQNTYPSKLPWPPTQDDRQEIGTVLREVLRRSAIPEAAELLRALPSNNNIPSLGKSSDSKIYFGEWRLDEDTSALWTVRVRNELIRHQYKVFFTRIDGRWTGSDLDVVSWHSRPKSNRVEQ